MTVNNLLNMSVLKGLEMIALTDHNTCKNCPALVKAARGSGLAVIPGMELTTAEEIHLVCLFPGLENAMDFDALVRQRLFPVENRPEIFGEQQILNELDEVVGQEELLLINATSIGIAQAPALVRSFGGICYPAHIDKQSSSVLAILGEIPPECGFRAVEVHSPEIFFAQGQNCTYQMCYTVVTSSDAHYLGDISERERCIHLETADFAGLAARLL